MKQCYLHGVISRNVISVIYQKILKVVLILPSNSGHATK